LQEELILIQILNPSSSVDKDVNDAKEEAYNTTEKNK